MRIRNVVAGTALVVPFLLGGCSALGLDSTMVPADATPPPGPVSDAGWIVTAQGEGQQGGGVQDGGVDARVATGTHGHGSGGRRAVPPLSAGTRPGGAGSR